MWKDGVLHYWRSSRLSIFLGRSYQINFLLILQTFYEVLKLCYIYFFGFLIGWWKFAVVLQSAACSSCCYPGFCLSPWNSRCWWYSDVAVAVKFGLKIKILSSDKCLSIHVAYDWSNLILICYSMSHVAARVGESSLTLSSICWWCWLWYYLYPHPHDIKLFLIDWWPNLSSQTCNLVLC
jgi:hypothetical protein